VVIAPVSHVLMSWLKLYALANVPRIVVTSPVSHPLMSWLKTTASIKVFSKVVTEAVSHILMSWLKADAFLNVQYKEVAAAVSHPPISSLKNVSSSNVLAREVTPEMSHSEISPYVAAAFVWLDTQSSTAVLMLDVVIPVSSNRLVSCETADPIRPKSIAQMTKLPFKVKTDLEGKEKLMEKRQ